MKKTILVLLIILMAIPLVSQVNRALETPKQPNGIVTPLKAPSTQIQPGMTLKEQIIAWAGGWLTVLLSTVGGFLVKGFNAWSGNVVKKQKNEVIKKACSAARKHIGESLSVALVEKLPSIIKRISEDGVISMEEFQIEIKEAILEAKTQLKSEYITVLKDEFSDFDQQLKKWALHFLSGWVLRFLENKYIKPEAGIVAVNS